MVPASVKQTTMTGSDWRYAAAYWPAMVAGLFQRRDESSVAPCAATVRQSRYGAAKQKTKQKGTKRARSASPVGADAIAAVVAGSSDCSDDEQEDVEVQHPGTSGPAYEMVYKNAPVSDAVLEVVCRAAALSGRLSRDNCVPSQGMTEPEAIDLAKEAYEFVTLYVAALLGDVNHSKHHRLAYHLLRALTDHGNLDDGDTSANEVLHKKCKRMYARTSKKHADYTLQMLRAEQTLASCIQEALGEHVGRQGADDDAGSVVGDGDVQEWTGGALSLPVEGDEDSDDCDDDGGFAAAQAVPDVALSGTGPHELGSSRKRAKGRRSRVVDLVAGVKGNTLADLAGTLGVMDSETLVIGNSVAICPTLEWGASLDRQRVHATASNHGFPWYDFIRYRDPNAPTEVQHGLVRLVVTGVGSRSTRLLVVQRLETADSDANCVRTRFGFRRLKWMVPEGAAVPALAVVDLSHVLRLEQVEPDFVPFTEQYGLFAKPFMPTTAKEWCERRFFTNPFHPWTSSPVVGH